MEKALIFTAVGTGLFFDDAYDKDNNWRYTKPERTYETCVIVFNDFEPEPNTYDYIFRKKGFKYDIITEVANTFDLDKYDYIGYYDDDHTTDIQSLNEALAIARHYDFKLFCQSLATKCDWPTMQNDPSLFYTETDFIEMSIPIFRTDMFKKILPLFDAYKDKKVGWGMDKVFCHFLQTNAHVIHRNSAKHMRPNNSHYKHTDAFAQMHDFLTNFYPKYVKEHMGIDNYQYFESQKVLKAWKLE
jgi:hypothetical protein